MSLKWGIAADDVIAQDLANVILSVSKDEHEMVAIACDDLNSAKEFAQRFEIPNAYDNYLSLGQNPNVEIVYVGMLIPQHFEVAKMMLDHGKHVLVRKPMCFNEKQAQQLLAHAKQKNLFLMEAMWPRFFPAHHYIRKQIADGKLGDIISVESSFGDANNYCDRLTKRSMGGGVTIDMGPYPIHLCQWVFQQEPKSIKATGVVNEEGVEIEMVAELNYGDNKVGKVRASVINTWPNEATIVGTKGTIKILNPSNAPHSIIDVDGTEKTWKIPSENAKYPFHVPNINGLIYQAIEVRNCIRAGKTECEFFTHHDSIVLARIEDEIRRQLGAHYE